MIQAPSDWAVRYKLALALCLGLLAFALAVVVVVSFQANREAAALEHRAASVSLLLGSGVGVGLEFGDAKYVASEIGHLAEVPDARWAVAWDEADRVFASWPVDSAPRSMPRAPTTWTVDELVILREIETDAGVVGHLAVAFDLQQVEEFRADSVQKTTVVAVVFLAAGLLVAWWMASWMVAPLAGLTRQLDQVATGAMDLDQLDTRVPDSWATSGDEIRRMSASVDRMRKTLVAQVEEIRRQRHRAVEAEKDAAAASVAKSAFLANMSHELRTPLNAILGYTELIREEADDEGREWCISDLDKVGVAGRHLLALINTILDLSKVEAGRLEIVSEDVSLDALLESVHDAVAPLVAGNDNTFVIDTPGPGLHLDTDRTRVGQCLINLLGNAAKFTSQGEIRLEVVQRGPHVDFRVSDTGTGMNPEILERLFEPFQQGGIEVQRKYGGTGLGLALTRRLARLMGGDVRATSAPGAGSVFHLEVAGTLASKVQESERPRSESAPPGLY